MYKRITEYMYSYENGEKRCNCGYCRFDLWEGQCKISINIRVPDRYTWGIAEIYLLRRKDDILERVMLGKTGGLNGIICYKYVCSRDMLPGGCSLDDVKGLLVFNGRSLERVFACSLGREELDIGSIRLFREEEEQIEICEKETAEDEQEEAQWIEAQQSEKQKIEAEQIEARQEEERKTETQKIDVQQEEKQQTEAQKIEAQQEEVQRTEAQKIEVQQEEVQRTKEQKIEVQQEEVQRTEAQKIEAQQEEAQRAEAQNIEVQQEEVHSAGEECISDGQREEKEFDKLPESMEGQIEEKAKAERTEYRETEINSGEGCGEEVYGESAKSGLRMEDIRKTEYKEENKQAKTREAEWTGKKPKGASENAQERQGIKDAWQEVLFSKFPKVRISFDGESCEAVKLRPHDLVWFPRKYWRFSNNKCLLNGYYNYRYIMLVRGVGDRAEKYYLAVPGKNMVNEAITARKQGFSEFVANKGDFGFWCYAL